MLGTIIWLMIEIILAIFCGILAGTITGLIPGLHVNLVATLLASFTLPSNIAIPFLVSLAITHTFLDIIPAVFLMAPEGAHAARPIHKLAQEGLGYEAVKYATVGGIFAILLITLSLPILSFLFSFDTLLRTVMKPALLVMLIVLICTSKKPIHSVLIIILAVYFGVLLLDSNISNPLFLLFSGLFACSSLWLGTSKVSRQVISGKVSLTFKNIGSMVVSLIICSVCTLLPGMGAAHAAVLSKYIAKTDRSWLLISGALNTFSAAIAILYVMVGSRARSGIAVALLQVGEVPIIPVALLILAVTTLVVPLTLGIGRFVARKSHLLNTRFAAPLILMSIVIIAITLSGWLAILVLFAAGSIGLLAHSVNVSKTCLLACIIIPLLV